MPLKPNTRPIGQIVEFVNDCQIGDLFISAGTRTVIQGHALDEDSKVRYKILHGDKFGNPTVYWVRASDLKKV